MAFQFRDLPLQKGDPIGLLGALRRRAIPILLHPFGVGVVVHRQNDLRLVFYAAGDHPGICAVPCTDFLIDFFRFRGFFTVKRTFQLAANSS